MEDSRQFASYQETLRAKNMNSCNALLSRLAKYHGEAFVKVEPVIVVEAAPEPEPEPELPPPPVSPAWIKMIEDMPDPKGPSVREIKIELCRHFQIAMNDLISSRRTAKLVLPRQIGYYLSKKLTTMSLPQIGRRFGGKDHSSVHHGIKQIEIRMEKDPSLATVVNCLEAQFR